VVVVVAGVDEVARARVKVVEPFYIYVYDI